MQIENKRISGSNKNMPVPEAAYSDLCKLGFFNYRRAKLAIVWSKKISRNKQIILLKKLYPKLNEMSSVQIYNMADKDEIQWKFAEMGWGNAMDLKNAAEKLGLEIMVEEIKTDNVCKE